MVGCLRTVIKRVDYQRVFCASVKPAKVSLGLAKRIYRHALDEGWLAPGSLCIDPMAGIATFGLVAATYGIPWVGIELEERFVAMGQGNIALHTREWLALGKPLPLLRQGDARNLQGIMPQVDLVVSSPPYADGCQGGGPDPHHERAKGMQHSEAARISANAFRTGYSQPQAIVSSPPFLDARQDTTRPRPPERMNGALAEQSGRIHRLGACEYGTHTAQLGAMREGSLAAVITSPPYESAASNCATNHGKEGKSHWKAGGIAAREGLQGYGESQGQVGNLSHETYWSEIAKIYTACHAVLPPQSYIILVVKGFIRRGTYQDLPAQTAQLLEHVGFQVLHYHKAMLSSRVGQSRLFDDGEDRTSRKSFFRRLAEARGAPVIDHEAVLCAVKP